MSSTLAIWSSLRLRGLLPTCPHFAESITSIVSFIEFSTSSSVTFISCYGSIFLRTTTGCGNSHNRKENRYDDQELVPVATLAPSYLYQSIHAISLESQIMVTCSLAAVQEVAQAPHLATSQSRLAIDIESAKEEKGKKSHVIERCSGLPLDQILHRRRLSVLQLFRIKFK